MGLVNLCQGLSALTLKIDKFRFGKRSVVRDKCTFMQEKIRRFLFLKDVIKVISPQTHSLHLPFISSRSVSGPLTCQGFLSACLQVCGSFESPAGVA